MAPNPGTRWLAMALIVALQACASAAPAAPAAHTSAQNRALPVSEPIRPQDLNQATRAEIEAVRGVGVELSERLLQARTAAAFADWQDLRRRVKGVSRRALAGFAESGFHIGGRPPEP